MYRKIVYLKDNRLVISNSEIKDINYILVYSCDGNDNFALEQLVSSFCIGVLLGNSLRKSSIENKYEEFKL